MKGSFGSLKCLITFDVSEQIRFIDNGWLNGMLSFKDFGCAKSKWKKLRQSFGFL